MDELIILPSEDTPYIIFKNSGELSVSGISIPENVNNFYKPVFDWLETFVDSNNEVLLTFDIEYMNTSSTRVVLQMINKIKNTIQDNSTLKIFWKYEIDDVDMLELGEDLQESSHVTFDFMSK